MATTCIDCRYYSDVNGECYAMPPVVWVNRNGYNSYIRPKVKQKDISCSLYKRKELMK